MKSRRNGRIGVLALAVTVSLVSCGQEAPLGSSSDFSQRQRSTVPMLVGLRFSEAVCRLRAEGLRWQSPEGPPMVAEPIECDPSADGGGAIAPDPVVEEQRPAPGILPPRDLTITLVTDCNRGVRAGCA